MNLMNMSTAEMLEAVQAAKARRAEARMENGPLTKDADFMQFVLDGYDVMVSEDAGEMTNAKTA